MKCEKCGSEIAPGQKFCGNCGKEQVQNQKSSIDPFETQGQNPMYSQPQNQGQQGEEPDQTQGWFQGQSPNQLQMGDLKNYFNRNDTILTVFSLVCALYYGVTAIKRLFSFVRALFLGYLFGFRIIVTAVFTMLDVALCIWMCLILVCMAGKRTQANRDGLLLCLAGGGVALAVERLFQGFVYKLFYYGGFSLYFRRFSTTLMGALLVVGCVYAILHFVMGENPIVGKSVEELLSEIKAAIFGLEKTVVNLGSQFNREIKTRQNQNNQDVVYTQAPFRLKTDRSLVVFILLNIVTCGIYSLFFIYALARDINVACAGDGRNTAGLIKLILLSFITCGIYDWIWYYSLGNRLASNAPRYGMNFQENGTTILLWRLVGMLLCGIGPLIAMNIIIKNTNMLCGAYNHQHNM